MFPKPHQRQDEWVQLSDSAARIHGDGDTAQLQALMNGTAQTREENLTLPQTVNVDGESLQKLRHHQLRDEK